MATAFAFEITEIGNMSATVVLRDGNTEYRVDFDSFIGADGLAQFLRAVFDVVDDRLWGAIAQWPTDQWTWLVDVRRGSAWYEVTVFNDMGNDWPPALQPATAVFQARIDDELDLARIVAATYRSVLERYSAARYAELWEHPFPHADLDALTDWIRRQEECAKIYALEVAILQQIELLGTRSPETIAAVLQESPERIAAILQKHNRYYPTRLEIDLHYQDPF